MTRYAALLAVLMVGIAVGQKPFECDHSKLQSCASQANDDYGPGRLGLVGELTPEIARQIQDAERIDVPAIQVADEWGNCAANSGVALHGQRYDCLIPGHMSCADKSRILEHDEQTPAKYWCRKVQP